MSCGMSLIFVASVIKRDIGNTVITKLLFSRLYRHIFIKIKNAVLRVLREYDFCHSVT